MHNAATVNMVSRHWSEVELDVCIIHIKFALFMIRRIDK